MPEVTTVTRSGKWEALDEGTGGLGDSATQTRQGRVHRGGAWTLEGGKRWWDFVGCGLSAADGMARF